MVEIKEELLHHIWKHRMFSLPLADLDEEEVDLVDPGQQPHVGHVVSLELLRQGFQVFGIRFYLRYEREELLDLLPVDIERKPDTADSQRIPLFDDGGRARGALVVEADHFLVYKVSLWKSRLHRLRNNYHY